MFTDSSAPKSPLRRSPRLAKKGIANWRERFEGTDVFRGIDDAQDVSTKPAVKQSPVKQTNTTKKRVMSASDLLATASAKRSKKPAASKITNSICTPNKSIVNPTVAVSPWGLPKDAKVDPKLALSPPLNKTESIMKSAKNRKATPYKPSAKAKAQVQFTSDTVFIEALALRKNVPRKQKTSMKCTSRVGTPLSFGSQPKAATVEASAFSFPSPTEQSNASSGNSVFTFGAVTMKSLTDIDEKCFEEKRLEHYFARIKKQEATKPAFDVVANAEKNDKENDIEVQTDAKPAAAVGSYAKSPAASGLRTAMGSTINWSPIKSSKSTVIKMSSGGNERKQSGTTRVQFASDVVFTTRAPALKARNSTPHKAKSTLSKVSRVTAMSPAQARTTSSLLQTGAVRLNVVYHTNPRKRSNHGTRLIDSGAVRRVVTRHTTPRKLIGNRNMWSPPPTTGKLPNSSVNLTQNEMSTPPKTPESASKRSNASTGGHRYRAALSPQVKEGVKHISKVLFQ
ncbi:hypothetical protein ACHAXN_001092 [Cyclotella atomus]